MNIIFAGTPDFAVPSLRALLLAGHEVVTVYCQPDRPAGRGRKTTPGPVKATAQAENISVCQPQNFKDPAEVAKLASLRPDLMIVVAYGLILPESILKIPRLGCINVHASLLPRWRGAAPIQRAIEAGDKFTGLSIMQMDAGLDTGKVLATTEIEISATETAGQLHDRLAEVGGNLLAETLPKIETGQIRGTIQDEELVSYAKKLDKREARLDWSLPADVIARKIRAFNPWPMAYTCWQQNRLRIWEATVSHQDGGKPGTILAASGDGILVATGAGSVNILSLQSQGGKAMAVKDFLNGQLISPGDLFV
ncbi:MAG: methionyl-tRNA formyltransferase [Acidiferrobacterales bacterium]